jgi:5-hydroxyisourate hydrolase / 2-oxo-4-hydroxy-4-carboxy-5-ureidoimidazoline decarboxylase
VTLNELNALTPEAAAQELARCCGSKAWVQAMTARRPFSSIDQLFGAAEEIWWSLDGSDWLEAFSHHPAIGDREGVSGWAKEEQSGTRDASEATRDALVELNREYERRFGHVFLISATGKTADEMLAELRARMHNPRGEELNVAAGEQAKITRLRLEKLIVPTPRHVEGSMITTHILDTSVGRPASGVLVALARIDGERTQIASGVTDADGRLRDLVPSDDLMPGGVYELTFETGAYYRSQGIEPFHPRITVTVEITDPRQHYHVPLLVSPFGYTTYRGS